MWRMTEMPTFRCPCSCNGKDQHESDFEAALPDAQTAILCSDGLNTPSDLASAKDYFENLSSKSEWADIWANIRLNCARWPKAKKGFQGPVKGKTASPILFIGNTAGTSRFLISSCGRMLTICLYTCRPCDTVS